MGCPLTVFQGGQILLPSTECVVSTGDPWERLGCLGCSLGAPPQPIPTLYNDTSDLQPLREIFPLEPTHSPHSSC